MADGQSDNGGVTNDHPGDSVDTVMAGSITGDIYFGDRHNSDISILLQSEEDEVALVIDRPEPLPIEINSRHTESRQLVLRAHGVPAGTWEIMPSTVTVSQARPARSAIILRCGNSTMAGRYQLHIGAEDPQAERHVHWRSNVKTIVVPPVTLWDLADPKPTSNVMSAGRYRFVLTLRNIGTTRLFTSLDVPEPESDDISVRALGKSRLELVGAERVALLPGQAIDHDLYVTLPTPGLRERRWLAQLAVDVGREGAPTSLEQIWIVQHGRVSAIRPALAMTVGGIRRFFSTRTRRRSIAALTCLIAVFFLLALLIQNHHGIAERSAPTGSLTIAPSTSKARPQDLAPPVPRPEPATTEPAQVVETFYAAVNRHDYQAALRMSAGEFGPYSKFKRGYARTVHDSLTVDRVTRNTVYVHISALQADNKIHHYVGYYIVVNGIITHGQLKETSSAPTVTR